MLPDKDTSHSLPHSFLYTTRLPFLIVIMQFALFSSVVLSALAAVSAVPINAADGNSLVVWSPKITSPTADTTWTAGQVCGDSSYP